MQTEEVRPGCSCCVVGGLQARLVAGPHLLRPEAHQQGQVQDLCVEEQAQEEEKEEQGCFCP